MEAKLMKISLHVSLIVFCFGIFLLLSPVLYAAGGESVSKEGDPAITKANAAIENKNWDRAIDILNGVIVHDMENADAYNLLGYSERNRGNLETAFKHYQRALSIDPEHRGAHEYIGEAYLMVGNLARAEDHLAKLDKLCWLPCEEYNELKAATADYKQKHGK